MGGETCEWRCDDGTVCGARADAFRTKHWPHKRTWWYCPLHAYELRSLAGHSRLDRWLTRIGYLWVLLAALWFAGRTAVS